MDCDDTHGTGCPRKKSTIFFLAQGMEFLGRVTGPFEQCATIETMLDQRYLGMIVWQPFKDASRYMIAGKMSSERIHYGGVETVMVLGIYTISLY